MVKWLFIISLAALNRFRGLGVTPTKENPEGKLFPFHKVVSYALMATAVFLCYLYKNGYDHASYIVFVVCLAGFAFWRQMGRGQYNAAYTGRWDGKGGEIRYVSWIVSKLYKAPEVGTSETNRRWAALCLTGTALHSFPLYAAMTVVTGHYLGLLAFALPLMEGVTYYLGKMLPEKIAPWWAESVTGALHGGALWIIL